MTVELESELLRKLRPARPQETPLPGFDTWPDFASWIARQARDQIVPLLFDVLRNGREPEQLAAAAALQECDVLVEARWLPTRFVWSTHDKTRSWLPQRQVIPRHQPKRYAFDRPRLVRELLEGSPNLAGGVRALSEGGRRQLSEMDSFPTPEVDL